MTQKRPLSERVIPLALIVAAVSFNAAAWFYFETIHEKERAFDQQWCAEQARKACER